MNETIAFKTWKKEAFGEKFVESLRTHVTIPHDKTLLKTIL
jgi:hypothetical protein